LKLSRDRIAEIRADKKLVDAVLKENEKRANRLTVSIFYATLAVVIFNFILNMLGVFRLDSHQITVSSLVAAAVCIFIILVHRSGRLSQSRLKWLSLFCIVLLSAWYDYNLSYNVALIMAVPMVFAVIYFSMRTTVMTYITTVIAFALSSYFGSLGHALLDTNHVNVPKGTVLTVSESLKQALIGSGFRNATYTHDLMLMGYLPKVVISVLLLVLCVAITGFGFGMLLRQAKQTAESTMLSTELKLAGELQASTLPNASALNGRYNFEISASMTAAKEAGGDFYDFTMLDDTHLALIIADVSGKGIPAAMFMMSAKERLRNAFAEGKTPAEILSQANNSLAENNSRSMFVTVWLGIIDISTGRLVSANGGHMNPIIRRASGELIECNEHHGMVLGARKNKSYAEQEHWLHAGDVLVQYTDGITEARNESGEFYGIERLLSGLSEDFPEGEFSADEINNGILKRVRSFMADTEQADDITTLIVKLK